MQNVFASFSSLNTYEIAYIDLIFLIFSPYSFVLCSVGVTIT